MNLFHHNRPRLPWNTSSIHAVTGGCCEEKSSIQNCEALQWAVRHSDKMVLNGPFSA